MAGDNGFAVKYAVNPDIRQRGGNNEYRQVRYNSVNGGNPNRPTRQSGQASERGSPGKTRPDFTKNERKVQPRKRNWAKSVIFEDLRNALVENFPVSATFAPSASRELNGYTPETSFGFIIFAENNPGGEGKAGGEILCAWALRSFILTFVERPVETPRAPRRAKSAKKGQERQEGPGEKQFWRY